MEFISLAIKISFHAFAKNLGGGHTNKIRIIILHMDKNKIRYICMCQFLSRFNNKSWIIYSSKLYMYVYSVLIIMIAKIKAHKYTLIPAIAVLGLSSTDT